MRLLIPLHTKIRFGSAFGLVKQRLKTRDIDFQSEMMTTMDYSSNYLEVIGPALDGLESSAHRLFLCAKEVKNQLLLRLSSTKRLPQSSLCPPLFQIVAVYIIQYVQNRCQGK